MRTLLVALAVVALVASPVMVRVCARHVAPDERTNGRHVSVAPVVLAGGSFPVLL